MYNIILLRQDLVVEFVLLWELGKPSAGIRLLVKLYSNIIIPTMGRSCQFPRNRRTYMGHGILHPKIQVTFGFQSPLVTP